MAVVTISREYGGGANHIAGLLCDRLGYRYFDKALMEQLGAPKDLKATLEGAEAAATAPGGNPFARFFRNIVAYGGASLEKGNADELPREEVERYVRIAYEEDNVVIVGRGGQMVLKDRPDVLHVRVIAPLERRIRTVQEFEGVTSEVARDRILRKDRSTAAYLRGHYGVDLANPTLYDVVLNMAKLTPAAGADAIIAALQHLTPRRV